MFYNQQCIDEFAAQYASPTLSTQVRMAFNIPTELVWLINISILLLEIRIHLIQQDFESVIGFIFSSMKIVHNMLTSISNRPFR